MQRVQRWGGTRGSFFFLAVRASLPISFSNTPILRTQPRPKDNHLENLEQVSRAYESGPQTPRRLLLRAVFTLRCIDRRPVGQLKRGEHGLEIGHLPAQRADFIDQLFALAVGRRLALGLGVKVL